MTALLGDLIGLGLPTTLAQFQGEDLRTATGYGTAQVTRGTALANDSYLVLGFNTVTTASGQTAVQVLDTMPVGRSLFINVTTATPALVFPPDGCSIQGAAVNAPITVNQNSPVQLFRVTRTEFIGLTAVTSTGGTGTVTSVGSGTGLTGGAITTSGALTIDQTPAIISAAGTVQGDATLIAALVNVVTTVASGAGVRLPASSVLFNRRITNHGANTLKIYPHSGGAINGLSADTPVQIASGGVSVTLVTADGVAWWVT